MNVTTLNSSFGRAGRIVFRDSPLGGLVVGLTAPASSAVVALQGAHVLSWQLAGMADVLWASPKARIATGKAYRGGIPVCWPWFGNHSTDPCKPAHGIARTASFSVAAAAASEDETLIQFIMEEPTEAQRALWPYRARLCVTVRIGKTLCLSLESTNLGNVAMPLSQALHTYFRVGDISGVVVEGLEGCRFVDTLSGRRKTESTPIRIGGEIDRIYETCGRPVRLIDHSLNRSIHVTATGSASTVVWNPWIAKSQRLSDMAADDYQRMICIETANAGIDGRKLEPGAVHVLSATIGAVLA